MGEIYIKVLLIMLVLFAFMAPGYALKKLNMVGEGGTLTLSNLLLYACQPALAIKAFCVFTPENLRIVEETGRLTLLKNFSVVAAISVAAIGVMFAVCKLVFFKAKDKSKADVYSYIAVFSNCGFLGIPFIEMFTDGDPLAVMYMMVFNIVFIITSWTLGVVLITGDFKEIRLKKLVCNPAIISIVVALLLFFVPRINFFMFEGLEELQIFPQYLSYATSPLSMVIVGIRLAEMRPRELFAVGGVYVAGALRLIAAPIITFAAAVLILLAVNGGLTLTDGTDYVYLAPVIAMTMSPAASVVAMAERFGGDKQTATAAFVTDTLLSIIVIPLTITAVMAMWQAF